METPRMTSHNEEASKAGSVSHVAEQKGPRRDRWLVPIVFTVFVLIRALDRAFINRTLKIMGVYGGTLMNLYWPICIQFVTVCIVAGQVAKKRYIDGDMRYNLSWFSPWSTAASSAGPVPLHWLAMFSFLDQLNAAMQTVSQQYIPVPLQTPLNNTVTFWTAVFAFFYLGSRFKAVHYAGCLLILLACVTGVTVELQQHMLPTPQDSHGNPVHVSTGTLALFYSIYLAGVIPSAISNCYKQKKLKMVDLDIMWATLWAGNWQILWGAVFYTVNWIPYPIPGGRNQQSPSSLGSDLSDAWKCFMGTDPSPDVTSCSAEPAWVWFVVYLVFNMFFNILLLWLTKYLSATWASIGNVLCGNLYAVFNQWSVIGGDSARLMRLEDWLALAYSSVALWVYNTQEETNIDGKSVYGVALQGDTAERQGLLDDDQDPESITPFVPIDYAVLALADEGPSPTCSRKVSETTDPL